MLGEMLDRDKKCWKKSKNVGKNVGRRQICWGKCWIETNMVVYIQHFWRKAKNVGKRQKMLDEIKILDGHTKCS